MAKAAPNKRTRSARHARREHPDALGSTSLDATPPQCAPAPSGAAAFRSNQELYRMFYENSPSMHFTLDRHGTVLSINRLGAEQLGYTADELVGRSVLTLFHHEDTASGQRQLALLLDQPGRTRRWLLRKTRKDGTILWAEEEARAVRLADGSVFILVVGSDVSERMLTEDALRESRQQYKLLVDHATDIIYRADAQGRFTFVNPTAIRLMKYAEHELLGHRFVEFIRPDYRQKSERFYGRQFIRKTPTTYFEFPAVAKDGREIWFGQNVQTIQEADRVTGFLAVARDITERKRAEEALADSEKRLRTILETEPECVKVITEDGIVLEMNAAGLAMVEADSLEDVRGRSILPIVAPAHRDAFAEFTRRAYHGEPGTMQFEITGLKGRPLWLETHAVPLRAERDVTIGVLAITRDITGRKQIERALQASEERFRLLFEHATVPMTLLDQEKRYVKVNRAFCQLVGYGEHELIGQTYALLTHPDDLNRNLALTERALSGRMPGGYYLEKRYLPKDGALLWVSVTASLIRLPDNPAPFLLAFIQDITERKRTEERLKATSQKLETLLQTGPLAIISLDAEGDNVVRWNQAAEQMFGWREQDVLGRPLPNIPPGLEEASEALWNQAVQNGGLRGVELQRLRKDGTLIDIALWATIVKDARGRIMDTFGIIEDITDRKRVEKALHLSERALRRSLREREQLARNLHDNIIQSIYAIGLTLEECQRLAKDAPADANRKLDQVIAALNRVIREVRSYLVPPAEKSETLSAGELVTALQHMGGLMENASGTHFLLTIDRTAAEALTAAQRAQFLYVAQEAMSNSLRHSGASTAHVSLARTQNGVRLEICDNGGGFVPQRIRSRDGGLQNIRARARKIGAHLDITSQNKQGTIVSMEIPTNGVYVNAR